MKKRAVIEHFGSEANVARFLGITRGAVNQWGRVIPEKRAKEIEQKTRGALRRSK